MEREPLKRLAFAGLAALGIAAAFKGSEDAGAVNLEDQPAITTTFSGPLPAPTNEPTPGFIIKTPQTQESTKRESPTSLPTAVSKESPVLDNVQKTNLSYLFPKDGELNQETEWRIKRIEAKEGVEIIVCQNCGIAVLDIGGGELGEYLTRINKDGSLDKVPLYKVTYRDRMRVIADLQEVKTGTDGRLFCEETGSQAMLWSVQHFPGEGQDVLLISGENFSPFLPPEGMKFKDNIVASSSYSIMVEYSLVGVDGTEKIVAIYNPRENKFVFGGPGDILKIK